MKTKRSAFLSLLFLAFLVGCGNEQFGTGGQAANSTAPTQSAFSAQSCSNYSLIKPKVDVLYVVDNSSSSYYLASDIKVSLQKTVDRLSQDFDYRVIGTQLIATPSGDQDYQVMTNSTQLAGLPTDSRRITSSSQFTFFSNASGGANEVGLSRVHSFINTHKNGLLRSNAYTLVVLISNGRDVNVEPSLAQYGNNEVGYNSAAFNTALNNLRTDRSDLQALQLRLISVTAQSSCKAGWFPSTKSYVQMSAKLYQDSGASDQSTSDSPDAYDLCGGNVSTIFQSINNAVRQVIVPHQYRYWPITFADNNASTISLSDIKVTKVSSNGSKTELSNPGDWTLQDNGSAMQVNTRELPSAGEPVTGRFFVKFTNLLVYPDCVLVSSVTQVETFNYVVLPKKPLLPVTVKVNGAAIPQSALDTSGVNNYQSRDIKFGPANTPPVIKAGYMIKITDPQYYYKSGDSVEALYTPAGL